MKITEEEKGVYLIIGLEGELTVHSITQVRDKILKAMDIGHTRMAILLDNVSHIDSSGVGLIANAAKRFKEVGGQLVIFCPSGDIRDVLNISFSNQLVRIIDDYDYIERLLG
jgi:anti-anti-sigma factor